MSRSRAWLDTTRPVAPRLAAVAAASLLALLAGCVAPPPPAPPPHRVWHPAHYRWDGARWILIPGHASWVS